MSSSQIITIDPSGVGRVRLRSIEFSDNYLHKPAPTDPIFDGRSSLQLFKIVSKLESISLPTYRSYISTNTDEMSHLKSSLYNILHHSSSSFCTVGEDIFFNFEDSSVRKVEIDLIARSYTPKSIKDDDELTSSISKLAIKAEDILLKTSGHKISFFSELKLIIEFRIPNNYVDDVWAGYHAYYKFRLIASYRESTYDNYIELNA
jgi:hypothetical protein